MENELLNMYVERLHKEIAELNKNRILIETHLQLKDQIIAEQNEKIIELETKAKKPKKEHKEPETF